MESKTKAMCVCVCVCACVRARARSLSLSLLFSIFISDLPLHITNISVACDMLSDDTTLHASGKYIMQVEHTLQESLDQVSCWCDNNSMVINPKKTHSDSRYKAEASAVTFIA